MAENRSLGGLVCRESACIGDFVRLGQAKMECKDLYFLCEIRARFSAVNKKRCGFEKSAESMKKLLSRED